MGGGRYAVTTTEAARAPTKTIDFTMKTSSLQDSHLRMRSFEGELHLRPLRV